MKRFISSVLAFLLLSVPVLSADITANGMYQKDVHTFLSNVVTLVNELKADHATTKTSYDALRLLSLNQCLSDGGIAIGSTATKVQLTATVNYLIDGEFKTTANVDDAWTLSGDIIPTGNYNKYVLYLDADGATSIGEGTAATPNTSVVLPALESSKSVIGVLTVEARTVFFDPGTTNLSAANIYDVYVDGFDPLMLPAGPGSLSASTDLTLKDL